MQLFISLLIKKFENILKHALKCLNYKLEKKNSHVEIFNLLNILYLREISKFVFIVCNVCISIRVIFYVYYVEEMKENSCEKSIFSLLKFFVSMLISGNFLCNLPDTSIFKKHLTTIVVGY